MKIQGSRPLGVEQLRNPEVEQLELALRGDEDVGRFDVPMHDEIAVRVLDGVAKLFE